MPGAAAENPAPCRGRLLLALLVALRAKVIDVRLHPRQQRFGRQGADPGTLQGQNLFPLATDLQPHSLDFGSEALARSP